MVHTNACNFLTDAPIDTCFTENIMWSFGIYCAEYGAVIGNHYKITLYTYLKKLAKICTLTWRVFAEAVTIIVLFVCAVYI